MKFDQIKPGMVFRQDVGGEYGTKFWFVYEKQSDKFLTILFSTRKSYDERVAKVTVPRDLYNNPDYQWRDREPVSVDDLKRYRKTLIPGIFDEL